MAETRPDGSGIDRLIGEGGAFVREAPHLLPRAIERGRAQLRLASTLGCLLAGRLRPRSAQTAAPPERSREPVRTSRPIDRATPSAPTHRESELAIPDYDSLSASQVIARLESLQPAERTAIREYETASRGRRTILHRISQLETT